jgi:hypothetical protein
MSEASRPQLCCVWREDSGREGGREGGREIGREGKE